MRQPILLLIQIASIAGVVLHADSQTMSIHIATALAFLAVATSHMSGHLSMLNSQGAAGLGMVLIVIQFLLYASFALNLP